jgi:hypothetical protein
MRRAITGALDIFQSNEDFDALHFAAMDHANSIVLVRMFNFLRPEWASSSVAFIKRSFLSRAGIAKCGCLWLWQVMELTAALADDENVRYNVPLRHSPLQAMHDECAPAAFSPFA